MPGSLVLSTMPAQPFPELTRAQRIALGVHAVLADLPRLLRLGTEDARQEARSRLRLALEMLDAE